MITQSQIDFFNENGYLRLEQVYSPAETQAMSDELNTVMQTFANWDSAWRGPWRKDYIEDEQEQTVVFVRPANRLKNDLKLALACFHLSLLTRSIAGGWKMICASGWRSGASPFLKGQLSKTLNWPKMTLRTLSTADARITTNPSP